MKERRGTLGQRERETEDVQARRARIIKVTDPLVERRKKKEEVFI